MTDDKGKYDEECAGVRERTDAEAVILIVLNGKLGSGFSVQVTPEILLFLPELLHSVANDLDAQRKLGHA